MAQTIKNADIAGLVGRLVSFRSEMLGSQSAMVPNLQPADLLRLNSYLLSAKSFKSWVVKAPNLDLPKTHPNGVEVVVPEPIKDCENADILDILRMLDALICELVNGQSADLSTGLISFDAKRFDDIVNKIELFLTDYVGKATPLDLPESAISSVAK